MTNGERFKDLFGLYATEVWAMPEKDFLEWLNALPTIEAEPIMYDTGSWQTTVTDLPPVEYAPIKHGQWLSIKVMDDEADFGETDGAECSVCGYTTNSEYWAKTYYHYCPKCGTRMDAQIGEEIQQRNRKTKRITADYQREMEAAWNRWEDSDNEKT